MFFNFSHFLYNMAPLVRILKYPSSRNSGRNGDNKFGTRFVLLHICMYRDFVRSLKPLIKCQEQFTASLRDVCVINIPIRER